MFSKTSFSSTHRLWDWLVGKVANNVSVGPACQRFKNTLIDILVEKMGAAIDKEKMTAARVVARKRGREDCHGRAASDDGGPAVDAICRIHNIPGCPELAGRPARYPAGTAPGGPARSSRG